jgi:molybdenum cofactor cytidylyltransferase
MIINNETAIPFSSAPIIAGLIPAAGFSRRMGCDKRLLLYGDKTVLETTAASLHQAGISPIIIVVEADSPCLALPGLQGMLFAVNPHPQQGMLSSIRIGLQTIPMHAEAVAVLPGDHPFVPSTIIRSMIDYYLNHRPKILVPQYSGKRGHPLIIHRSLFSQAMACDDQIGLRQLIQNNPDELVVLDLVAPDAECDLDLPSDLEKLKH